MAIIKLLSSKDDEATKNFLKTESGKDLKTLNKFTLADIAQYGPDYLTDYDKLLDQKDILFKETLFNKVNAGELNGRFADKEGEIFDHIVIEFSNDKEYADKASKIILNRLFKPDTTIIKNQGGGKIQEKNITGEKQLLWDLHEERNGDLHLHVLVNRYDIDGNKINPQNSFKDKYVRDKFLNLINEDLHNANLATLNDFTTGITPQTISQDKPSLATQNVVKEIIRKGGDISDIELGNNSISEVALSNEVQRLEKEAATLIEQANRKIQEAKEISKAKEAVDNNKILINELSLKDAHIEKIQEQIEQLETLKFNYEQEIEKLNNNNNEHIEVIQAYKENVEELNNKIIGLENDYNNIEEESNNKDIIINSKDEELKQQKTTNNHLAKALDLHEETIRELKRNSDTQKEEYSKLERLYNELKGNFDLEIQSIKEGFTNQLEEQNKQIIELKGDNDILANEVARKDKDISVLTELYKEVKSRLSSTTNRLKNVVSKIANADIKEALKSVVMDNNQFEKSLEAIDKEPNDKMDRIKALREKFAQGKIKEEVKENNNNNTNKNKPK